MSEFLPFTRPTIDEETIAGVAAVLRSGWITTGPQVARFEAALAAYVGGGRIVRVMTSATAGLEMALQGVGIGAGDEVIVPAMSFAATANVVVRVGAKPVFVDVELRSRNLDVQLLEAALTPRTRAIMPVHFAGLAADMDRVNDIAAKHRVRVVEDAAHAIGTEYHGRKIGSFGDIVCFSFHPNKNMTTIEGGAVASTDKAALKVIERQRFHGIERDADNNVDVVIAGGKSNLSDVSASIGLAQLAKLDAFNAKRRELVAHYFERLHDTDLMLLPERGDAGHAWHIFTVLIDFARLGLTRPKFIEAMATLGIGVGVHYPSIPSLSFYREQGYRPEQYPQAARIGEQIISLPLFPAMSEADVERVCVALLGLLNAARPARSAKRA
jgi:dTDP-4-amino-4,6-dideoxygalactose transaminase